MTDNTEVKNGNYNSGKKCPTYCDFCDWLGSWKNCFIYKELKKQKARWGNDKHKRRK